MNAVPTGGGRSADDPGAVQVSVDLDGSTGCIARARHFATDFLSRTTAALGRPIAARTAEMAPLVVSELVTNACKYAPGPIQMDLQITGRFLEITVWDSDPVLPMARAAEPGRIGQHGLEIVMIVAEGFEVQREKVGKRVTARLALTEPTVVDGPHAAGFGRPSGRKS